MAQSPHPAHLRPAAPQPPVAWYFDPEIFAREKVVEPRPRTRSVYLVEYASDPQNVTRAADMVASSQYSRSL